MSACLETSTAKLLAFINRSLKKSTQKAVNTCLKDRNICILRSYISYKFSADMI